MKGCCGEINVIKEQRKVLTIVLIANAIMFFIEFLTGWLAHSTALLGDSLDMLGDAVLYGLTLFVLDRTIKSKVRVALFKGVILGLFGVMVLIEGISKIFSNIMPSANTVGLIGILALLTNSFCLILLWKYRKDDLNMRSVYLCSRNDIISNVGVIISSILVYAFKSKWPDIILGLIIASLFLHSSLEIIKDSRRLS